MWGVAHKPPTINFVTAAAALTLQKRRKFTLFKKQKNATEKTTKNHKTLTTFNGSLEMKTDSWYELHHRTNVNDFEVLVYEPANEISNSGFKTLQREKVDFEKYSDLHLSGFQEFAATLSDFCKEMDQKFCKQKTADEIASSSRRSTTELLQELDQACSRIPGCVKQLTGNTEFNGERAKYTEFEISVHNESDFTLNFYKLFNICITLSLINVFWDPRREHFTLIFKADCSNIIAQFNRKNIC